MSFSQYSIYICAKINTTMKYLYSVCTFVLLLSLGSCASKKDLVYFQDAELLEAKESFMNYTPLFKADDQLSITVSALDNTAAAPFNLPVAGFNMNGTSAIGQQALQTYLIAKDGSIEFPQLGKLYVAGLSRLETIALLKEKLAPYLVDPVVNIQLLNFKVTILGEVKKPGSFTIKNERITILEAIGLAGDLTIFGKRHNVLIVRETSKGKVSERLDLSSSDLFNSPFYYLQQNDVIYIEPNKPKINSSTNSSTNGVIISITSLLITIVTILIR